MATNLFFIVCPFEVTLVKGVPGTFSEDFLTTINMNKSNTNVTGWGSGIISLPDKNLTLTSSIDTLGAARDLYVSGDYVYVTDETGITVVDVSDTANPLSTYQPMDATLRLFRYAGSIGSPLATILEDIIRPPVYALLYT